MTTPAHAVVNLLVLGRQKTPKLQGAIIAGAIIPDVPMFLFYFFEKVVQGTPEWTIWTHTYFEQRWQTFFDLFNSLPLIGLGLLVTISLKYRGWSVLLISMALHAVCDLLLHHDDAHRHFFLLSDWRFRSPVSYWDPNHFGGIVAPLEGLVVMVGCTILFRSASSTLLRYSAGTLGAIYVTTFLYAWTVWL